MNTPERIEELKRKSEAGNAGAQNALACAYYNGNGIGKNIPLAIELFQKAANGGNMYAQSNLAYRYRYGTDGIKKDLKKAFDLYLKSAEQGNLSAIANVGIFYDYGYGVSVNYSKAIEWYKKAASKGNSLACNNLGSKYQNGQGVERNYHIAFSWYKKAAEKGEEYAMCNLGVLYEEGKGVPVNLGMALYWYDRSSDKGHARAKDKMKSLLNKFDENMQWPCVCITPFSENPYKLLGVYSNASTKEILANKSRITALLKIGKDIQFPIDKLTEVFYTQEYPIQESLFPEPEDTRSVKELFRRMQYLLERLDKKKSDCEKIEDNEKIVSIKDEISSIRNELTHCSSEYERKRKKAYSVNRSLDKIEDAFRCLSQPEDKLKHALFWFMCVTEEDSTALDILVEEKSPIDATDKLKEKDNFSSLVNQAVIGLSIGENDEYISNITKLIHNDVYRNDFVQSICGEQYHITEEELSHLLINTLITEIPSVEWKQMFHDSGVSVNDENYISELLSKKVQDEVSKELLVLPSINLLGDRFSKAEEIKEIGIDKLNDIDYYIGKDNLIYQSVADKIAKCLLDCAIDYYNRSADKRYDTTRDCYNLCKAINDIAVGTTLKEQIRKQLEQIKIRLDNMPPEEIFHCFANVKSLLNIFKGKEKTVANALDLINKCVSQLKEIKEVVGKDNDAYVELSTSVAELALSFVIAELNEQKKNSHTETYEMRNGSIVYGGSFVYLLKDSCVVLLNIEKLDINIDFVESRLIPNKKVLMDNLGIKSLSDMGVESTIDMTSETEFFNGCKTLKEFQTYKTRYPRGKYVKQVDMKISQLKEEDYIFWTECVQNGNYKDYINKYKNRIHRKEAEHEIKKISEAEDNNFWSAVTINGDYDLYLEKYPNGIHSQEAYNKVSKKFFKSRKLNNKAYKDNGLYSDGTKTKRLRLKVLFSILSIIEVISILLINSAGHDSILSYNNEIINIFTWISCIFFPIFVIFMWILEFQNDPYDYELDGLFKTSFEIGKISDELNYSDESSRKTYFNPLSLPVSLISLIMIGVSYILQTIKMLATLKNLL